MQENRMLESIERYGVDIIARILGEYLTEKSSSYENTLQFILEEFKSIHDTLDNNIHAKQFLLNSGFKKETYLNIKSLILNESEIVDLKQIFLNLSEMISFNQPLLIDFKLRVLDYIMKNNKLGKYSNIKKDLKLIDIVKKNNNLAEGIFANINNDLNESISQDNDIMILMSYAYARRAVAAGLFFQGVFTYDSYLQASEIFKTLQLQTGQSVEFQEEAFNEAIKLLKSYDIRLDRLLLQKMGKIINSTQIKSYKLNEISTYEEVINLFTDKENSLLNEVKINSTKKIKELIQSGTNINIKDEEGNTLLILAILNKNIDVVNQLLEANINIFEKNLCGDTALSISLTKLYHGKDEDKNYYQQICTKLINLCDENIWEEYYYEAEHALIYASEKNKIDVVKKLIDAGMFLDFQNDMGRTALIQSLIKKNRDIAKLLIKAGARTDIQSDSSFRFSAIGWATSLGYEDVVDELIKVGTNINVAGSSEENHHTPLLEAIVKKHSNIAIKLIEAGANVNVYAYSNIYSKENFDEQGNYAKKYTPLLIASSDGNLNVVKKLIEFGANINFQNSSGYTALMFASLQKRTDIVKLLIDAGADMTLKNKEGKTALDLTLQNSETINS